LAYWKEGRILNQSDIEKIMLESIEESKLSLDEDTGIHPKVGAILTDLNGEVLLKSHRGETGNGDHCEYIILKKASEKGLNLKECIFFVTLEPCTSRSPGKTPCAKRIVQAQIPRVYIGMLDPNPLICGRGELFLRDHLKVERYPSHLVKAINDVNSKFVSQYKKELLPNSSLYVSKQISDIMLEYLIRHDLKLSNFYTDWDLTIDDIIENCMRELNDRSKQIIEEVNQARKFAYDKKYCDYTYENDYRGISDQWSQEIIDILAYLNISRNLSEYKIIDVGVGNGLEISNLFENVENLTFVDIAEKSLKHTKELYPRSKTIISPAEHLVDIEDESQDIYISLRTYQSSYFGINDAIKEANRVLKPDGVILISIANGFVDEKHELIPGLVIPKTQFVDTNRPYELANRIRNRLNLLRFKNIGIRTGVGEIYIWGRRS